MTVLKIIETKLEFFEKKTFIGMIMIVSIGLGIRLFFTPFHLPTNSFDGFLFTIEGLAYSNGDFSNFTNRFLWPMFLSLFFKIVDFENYFDYVNLARMVAISISVLTAPIIFGIAKKFVDNKYALIAAGLFVIEPNLIENSIFGITESLFIFLGTLSFYCILQKNQKFQLLAFLFAGLSFDTRLNGIVLLILILISFYLNKSSNSKKFFVIGILIFVGIILPAHFLLPIIEGTEPFPIIKNMFEAISQENISYSTYEYTDNSSSILLNAIKNEFLHIFRIAVPFLIILFPYGMIVSLKNKNFQNKMLFFGVLISLLIAIPQYTMSNEYRNLFFLIPFFSIFSAIGINELIKRKETKNIFLILFMMGLVLLSVNFLRERNLIDEELYLEKDRFGKYIVDNFEGRVTGDLRLDIIRNIPNLKDGNFYSNEKIAYFDPGFPIDSTQTLIEYLKENKIEFLVVEKKHHSKHFPIFNEIISNEKDFDFLEKILESSELNYKKINVEIFKIHFE